MSDIAALYDKFMFSFLRSLHIVFQSTCTSLHSHQQCMRVPLSLHPRQHFLLLVFLMVAILTGMRWNLRSQDKEGDVGRDEQIGFVIYSCL
jgi:hypothetical protein